MCGIAGYLDLDGRARDDAASVAERMATAVSHRGPDDAGTWVDATSRLAFGHRRLSIVDLSPLGHQPMRSASGRYTIIYNGEIYNFVELRDDLTARGYRFRGRSDTEVILASCDLDGFERTLQRITGMFAIAIW